MVFEKKGMNRKEIMQFLRESMKDAIEETDSEGNTFKSVYLGSFMNLDPCGKYHNILSPNSLTQRCLQFWISMDHVADELHGCITSGEGDATDVIFQFGFKVSCEKECVLL